MFEPIQKVSEFLESVGVQGASVSEKLERTFSDNSGDFWLKNFQNWNKKGVLALFTVNPPNY